MVYLNNCWILLDDVGCSDWHVWISQRIMDAFYSEAWRSNKNIWMLWLAKIPQKMDVLIDVILMSNTLWKQLSRHALPNFLPNFLQIPRPGPAWSATQPGRWGQKSIPPLELLRCYGDSNDDVLGFPEWASRAKGLRSPKHTLHQAKLCLPEDRRFGCLSQV